MIREACLVCEEETATGSPRYSSRKLIQAGDRRAFVCEDCVARANPERRRELSRAELARLHESAAVFGAWWSGGPGGGS